MIAPDVEKTAYTLIPLDSIISKLTVRRLSIRGVNRIQESMHRSGFLENYPLVVTPLGDGTYQLLDGNHRYESAKSLRIQAAPCIIKANLTQTERFSLALQSNNAAEAVVPSTLVTYAEFIWERVAEGYTHDEIGDLLGWHPDKVTKYNLLHQISNDAWAVIVTTFEGSIPLPDEEAVTSKVTTVSFTEGLLRSILDLPPSQQMELVQALVHPNKEERITKGRFNELAKAYQARNEMKAYAKASLGELGEPYITQLANEIESGAYDSEWMKSKEAKGQEASSHPKLDRLISAIYDEWERKNSIHLIHGDFYEEIKRVGSGSVDLILTDPPYNVANEREFVLEGRTNISQNFGEWDKYEHQEFIRLFDSWTREWARILKEGGSGYVFTSDVYLSHLREALERAGLTVKITIVWHKTNPAPQMIQTTYQSSVEYILFFTKGQNYTFHWLGSGDGEMHNFIQTPLCGGNERLLDAKKNTLHPTQKPLQAIKHFMVVSSNRGDMVFDGFAGVGSTGKAAKDMGRKFIGIEQDETFFKAMQRRLVDE